MANPIFIRETVPTKDRFSRKDNWALRSVMQEIIERVDNCGLPVCWTLKDSSDNGQIYLSKAVSGIKPQRVQIRRYLFARVYGDAPGRRKLTRRCKTEGCLNPAHMKAKGFEPSKDGLKRLFREGWLTPEQYTEYYAEVKDD